MKRTIDVTTGYDEEKEEDIVLSLPAEWIICGICSGEGKHSRRLGAFTREEFDQEFSPEEQEMYFQGAYDSKCENCGGTGKVLVVDEDRLTPEHKKAWETYCDDQRSAQAERDAEMRYGY